MLSPRADRRRQYGDSFSYFDADGITTGNAAVVSITATAPVNQAPLGANDSDPDGTLNSGTVTIASSPDRGGSVTVQRAFNVYRGDKMNHQPVTFLHGRAGGPWVRMDGFASAAEILREYRQLRGT